MGNVRRIITLILLLTVPDIINAQMPGGYDDGYGDTYTNTEVQKKFRSFTVMRNIGLATIGVSVAGMVTGIVMVSTSDIYTFEEQKAAERVNPDTTLVGDDKKFITGIMCIVVAIPFTAAGTALSVIGGRKRGEYKRRLYIRGLTMSVSGRKVSFTLPVDF